MARRGRVDSPVPRRPRSALARRVTQKSGSTRHRLVEAAVSLLARDGLAALNLGAVAAEAGQTRGCVQYYFPSQPDLVLALADHVARQRRETVAKAAEATSGDIVAFVAGAMATLEDDEHRLAEQELLMASRTHRPLRESFARHTRDLEAQLRSGALGMVDDAFLHSTRFRAGCDLARLVGHFANAEVWTDGREARIADMREALVFALRVIWAAGSPGGGGAKLRIRVPAASARR